MDALNDKLSRYGAKAALAHKLGLSRQAISKWVTVPVDKIKDVAVALGIPQSAIRNVAIKPSGNGPAP